jgi:hypothetical protein
MQQVRKEKNQSLIISDWFSSFLTAHRTRQSSDHMSNLNIRRKEYVLLLEESAIGFVLDLQHTGRDEKFRFLIN